MAAQLQAQLRQAVQGVKKHVPCQHREPTQGTHCKAGEVAALVLDAASIAGGLQAIGSVPPLGRLCRPSSRVLAAALQGRVGCEARQLPCSAGAHCGDSTGPDKSLQQENTVQAGVAKGRTWPGM